METGNFIEVYIHKCLAIVVSHYPRTFTNSNFRICIIYKKKNSFWSLRHSIASSTTVRVGNVFTIVTAGNVFMIISTNTRQSL